MTTFQKKKNSSPCRGAGVNRVIIFHHKLLTRREGRVLANERTRLSSMTMFIHLFIRFVIRKVATVTWNIIWHYIWYFNAILAHNFYFHEWECHVWKTQCGMKLNSASVTKVPKFILQSVLQIPCVVFIDQIITRYMCLKVCQLLTTSWFWV